MRRVDIRCYVCGSSDHLPYAQENGFELVKCIACGLLYVNPRPSDEDVSEAVKTGNHSGDIMLNVVGRFSNSRKKEYLKILSSIYGRTTMDHCSPSWLDIGAGYGEFILALSKFSNGRILAEGIEPNIHKRMSAERKGIHITYDHADNINNTYDMISLLNVFSHLLDPKQTLLRWKKLLKPNGELLIETGDTADLPVQDHPKPFLLPDHLSFASEKLVSRILRDIGFEIISIHRFRSPLYPLPTPWALARLLYSMVNGTYLRRVRFFPKVPHIDMWIRARLR